MASSAFTMEPLSPSSEAQVFTELARFHAELAIARRLAQNHVPNP